MSPRWNAGAMDSEITTIMGCEQLVKTESAFHVIKVVESTNRMGSISDAGVRINIVRLLLYLPLLGIVIVTFLDAHKKKR